MYEKFFGLDELPFQLTPDPRYLFLSSKHREALGHLVYGIREGAGFVCITGEIGAGKTTLLRALLREADETIHYAYVLNPVLTGVELLQEINHELGIEVAGTRRELLLALNQALLEHQAEGRRVVLVIDEAQALDGAILEQLRLLSNFETETAKLLQIVLVGQPELRDLLARPDLEQLNQRVTVRWHLGRLDRSETAQYVAHRLRTAGQVRTLFTPGALAAVHTHSRGVPRLINVVCHRALLVAYATDRPKVNRGVVRRALAELRRHVPARRVARRHSPIWAAASAVAAVLLGAVAVLGWQRYDAGPRRLETAEADVADQRLASAPVEPAADPAPEGGAPAGSATPAAGQVNDDGAAAAIGEGEPDAAGAASSEGGGAAAAADDGSEALPTAPAVDPLEIERVMLADGLRQTSPGNSAYEATEALLRAWDAKPLSPEEAARPSLDLRRIGAARGLEYLSFTGNLNLLRVLDLPAILELAPVDGSASRFVAVSHLDDEATRLAIGRSEIAVSPGVLAEAWFGKAHLFWRDLDRMGGVLSVGSVSPKVRRLHSLLRGVGVYAGPDAEIFGPATEEAVMRFQRGKRLFADGKAGPLTMITLYQSVADERVPRLASQAVHRERSDDDARVGMGGGGWN
jgi:general secretion pathway protein A